MKKAFPYQRILTIGCPGGGKSTYARALAAITGLPLVHLDLLYWNPDRTTVSRDVFDARLAAAMAGERWIIDGNYGRTQECRLDVADLVFFFDMPTDICLASIAARRGKSRPDLPWVEGEDEATDAELLQAVRDFPTGARKHILARLAARPHLRVVTFRSHEEADAFLRDLQA